MTKPTSCWTPASEPVTALWLRTARSRNGRCSMKRLVLLLLVASLGVVSASLSPDSPVCRKGRQTFWPHVYRPDRLKIIAQCITVGGTVEHIFRARDGDADIQLALDPTPEHILNDANRQYQHGALVVGIVC